MDAIKKQSLLDGLEAWRNSLDKNEIGLSRLDFVKKLKSVLDYTISVRFSIDIEKQDLVAFQAAKDVLRELLREQESLGYGEVVDKEKVSQALNELERLSEKGNAEAKNELGKLLIYSGNLDVRVNRAKGFKLIEESAKLGNDEAIARLFDAIKRGDIKRDVNELIYWAKKSAESDRYGRFAKTYLYELYKNGNDIIEKNATDSLKYLEGLNKYYPEFVELEKAKMYESGENGFEKNLQKAIEFYNKSLSGSGLNYDQRRFAESKIEAFHEVNKAVEFEKAAALAAEIDDPEKQINIAETYYENGDFDKALYFYKKAIENSADFLNSGKKHHRHYNVKAKEGVAMIKANRNVNEYIKENKLNNLQSGMLRKQLSKYAGNVSLAEQIQAALEKNIESIWVRNDDSYLIDSFNDDTLHPLNKTTYSYAKWLQEKIGNSKE
jgi:hypothetical protein